MNRFLTATLLIALALRVACVFALRSQAIQPDSGEYIAIAHNIAAGNGYAVVPGEPASKRLPAYPFFLSLMMILGAGSPLAVGLAQAVIGALLCLAVWYIGRRFFDATVARAATAAAALYPVLCAYAAPVLTETLFTVCSAAAVAFLAAARDKPYRYFAAGCIAGAALLVRPDILLLPLIGIAVIAVACGVNFRRAIKRSALYATGLVIVISPWLVRNYAVFGTLVPANTGGLGRVVWSSAHYAERGASEYDAAAWNALRGKYGATYGQQEPDRVEGKLFSEGASMIYRSPLRFAALFVRRFPSFWFTSHSAVFGIDRPNREYIAQGNYGAIAAKAVLLTLQLALLVLAAVGIAMTLFLPGRRRFLLLFAMACYPMLYIFLDAPGRHHVPFMPYLLLWASYAAVGIFRRCRREAA